MSKVLKFLLPCKGRFFSFILFFLFLSQSYAVNVTLEWDANTQPDLDYYVVYWDTVPLVDSVEPFKSYDIDKSQNSYIVTGLDEDTIYYFAVKAYDDQGRPSDYSNEAIYPLGQPPPPPPYDANFTADPTSGTEPLTVQFTDESTGSITSWSWDFGDGGTSTEQNASHIYYSPGVFTVSLTVTGPGGSDIEEIIDYINVTEGGAIELPIADFTAR
jgi:PKD repeat protein